MIFINIISLGRDTLILVYIFIGIKPVLTITICIEKIQLQMLSTVFSFAKGIVQKRTHSRIFPNKIDIGLTSIN